METSLAQRSSQFHMKSVHIRYSPTYYTELMNSGYLVAHWRNKKNNKRNSKWIRCRLERDRFYTEFLFSLIYCIGNDKLNAHASALITWLSLESQQSKKIPTVRTHGGRVSVETDKDNKVCKTDKPPLSVLEATILMWNLVPFFLDIRLQLVNSEGHAAWGFDGFISYH